EGRPGGFAPRGPPGSPQRAAAGAPRALCRRAPPGACGARAAHPPAPGAAARRRRRGVPRRSSLRRRRGGARRWVRRRDRAARGERALRRARRPRRGEGARGRPRARVVRSRRDARPLGADGVSFARPDGRRPRALRPIGIELGVSKFAEGSARISFGDTQVLCLATLQESVPKHLEGKGTGWVTAEYAMLPRSTPERSQRESIAGRPGGRTFEIQRRVGRALRSAVDLKALGSRSVIIDCEVIQADGGTRTAAITGGYVALAHALRHFTPTPLRKQIAAVSAGYVKGELMLDLAYAEDSIADADVNVVATSAGELIEVQGTAEGRPFSKSDFDDVLALALRGIARPV